MKKNKWMRVLYVGAVLVSFLLGTAGYLMAKETWYDATYYAVQMFFLNYSPVENGNVLIYVSRVLCPLMTAAGVAALLRDFFRVIVDNFNSRLKNATALYYDTEQMKEIGESFECPVYMEKKVNKKAKAHVLLLSSDVDNLELYEEIEKDLEEGSKVYIKLEEMDSKLLAKNKVYFFNINEIIARNYWKERNLKQYMVAEKMNVKIAIIGFDALGQNLLDYGLMNNIYSLKQSIQYHVWGDSSLYRNMLGDFDKMNGDTIIYHDADWKEEIMQLKEFDRIIVAQEPDIELLQALLYLSCDAEIDFYNPVDTNLTAAYEGDKLTPFGMLDEMLTEENIKTDKLYRAAKEVHYNYEVKHNDKVHYSWTQPDAEEVMETLWNDLKGFTKGSNVSSADYHYIRLLVMDMLGMDKNALSVEQMEMLAEMEHVRWSRYHYVNHWSYGGQGMSKEEAKAKRQHLLLVPYADLPREEKDKDIEVIKELFEERMSR